MNLQIKAETEGLVSHHNNLVYYRLIALWILCEAMLGGIIHTFRIPVSGLIVGSAAVICICLIAFYVPGKGNILKATIIVAIFKMMISPQAPILAYVAVFFQGIMGELLFWNKKFFKISCLLLGLIALLESGLQRIIVLTIVYGNNFWKAINDFINNLAAQKTFTNYSLYIASAYVGLHVLTGLIIGWWAGIIPGRVSNWHKKYQNVFEVTKKTEKTILPQNKKKRKGLKKTVFVIWIILLLLYLQSNFKIGHPVLPAKLPVQILIRSIIIILAWYFVIGPFFSWFIKKWLAKKQSTVKGEIVEITRLLPSIKTAMSESWKLSSTEKGIKKLILYCKLILVYTLHPPRE
jgi:hypothetical protein